MFIIQAAQTKQPTCLFTTHDATKLDLSDHLRMFFGLIKFDVDGLRTLDSYPGRIEVYGPCRYIDVFSDMKSCGCDIVKLGLEYARQFDVPVGVLNFLELCADHGLSLNKYLVVK